MDGKSLMKATAGVRAALADAICPEGRERRELAERAANTDPLTGLPNRRAFDLARPWAEKDHGTAFVMFDADNFGVLNKLLGQETGDKWIRHLSDAVNEQAQKHRARSFRIGGDEFVILCRWNQSGVIRDALEIEVSKWIRPIDSLSMTGGIGGNLAEADRAMRDRKQWKRRRDESRIRARQREEEGGADGQGRRLLPQDGPAGA
jgi:diguanylate cyclase (GGDEF)-like protein